MKIGEENHPQIWKADEMDPLQTWEVDQANHREFSWLSVLGIELLPYVVHMLVNASILKG